MRITHNAIRNAQRYSPDFVGRDYPATGAELRRQILAGEEVPRDRLTVEITPGGRAVRLASCTESGEPMGAIVVPDGSVDAKPGDLVCVTVGPLSGPAFTAPVAKPHSIALDEGTIRRIAEMVAELIADRFGPVDSKPKPAKPISTAESVANGLAAAHKAIRDRSDGLRKRYTAALTASGAGATAREIAGVVGVNPHAAQAFIAGMIRDGLAAKRYEVRDGRAVAIYSLPEPTAPKLAVIA